MMMPMYMPTAGANGEGGQPMMVMMPVMPQMPANHMMVKIALNVFLEYYSGSLIIPQGFQTPTQAPAPPTNARAPLRQPNFG